MIQQIFDIAMYFSCSHFKVKNFLDNFISFSKLDIIAAHKLYSKKQKIYWHQLALSVEF